MRPSAIRSSAWWWWQSTAAVCPSRPGELASRGGAHLAVLELPGGELVRQGALDVGQVLHQAAAEGHVQQLHAAADREHRQVPGERRLQDGELGGVPVGPQADGVRPGVEP